MNFSFYIAKRYLFTKSKNKAINYITLVAGLGIIFGTAALFVVLSGFDGLKAFSLEFTSFTDPDFKVFPYQTKTIKISSEHRQKINKIEDPSNIKRPGYVILVPDLMETSSSIFFLKN